MKVCHGAPGLNPGTKRQIFSCPTLKWEAEQSTIIALSSPKPLVPEIVTASTKRQHQQGRKWRKREGKIALNMCGSVASPVSQERELSVMLLFFPHPPSQPVSTLNPRGATGLFLSVYFPFFLCLRLDYYLLHYLFTYSDITYININAFKVNNMFLLSLLLLSYFY